MVIVKHSNVYLVTQQGISTSDSMVQPQMDRDRFRNVSNLNLVQPNQISDSIYACIGLLFANVLTLKMLHTCTYRSTMQDVHPMLTVTSITFFFVAYVKCGSYEINRNNRANATHGPSPVQNRTEAMLDRKGSGPGPRPVLTLISSQLVFVNKKHTRV